jgi:hypothetical protein
LPSSELEGRMAGIKIAAAVHAQMEADIVAQPADEA